MKTLLQMASLCLLLIGAFSATAFRPPFGPWEMLGHKKVNYGLDRDEIFVTRSEGVFSAIQIRVQQAPINMHKVAVHYGNGQVEDIDLRENMAAGSSSRVIDLPGNKRIIKKVVFWYDTKNIAARKGVIQLWGRH
jgi:hypothetical protein